jgi:hypothetical protein
LKNLTIEPNAPLIDSLHQVDTTTGRGHFQACFTIRRAGRKAKAAMDTGIDNIGARFIFGAKAK